MSTKTRISNYRADAGTVTLFVTDCDACGVIFALSENHESRLRENGKGFYCPNGHMMTFGKSAEDRERERANKAEARATALLSRLDRERTAVEHERNRARSLKGHQTRLKNRLAAGKCPCCSEQFPDLAEHISESHPDYTETVTAQ